MTVAERLQRAYICGRDSATAQITDHISAVASAMGEYDPVAAAAMKYAAEFANSLSLSVPEYEEDA